MLSHLYLNGSTSVVLRVVLKDSSGGKTAMAHNTSGLIISTIASNEASATTYTSASSNVEDISALGTYAAPSTNKCRFKEVDATNHPGLYEIHLANARFAVSGAKYLDVTVSGVSGLLTGQTVRVWLDVPADLQKIGGTVNASATLALAKLQIIDASGSGNAVQIVGIGSGSLVALTQGGTGIPVSVTSAANHAINVQAIGGDALRLASVSSGKDIRLAGTADVVGNFVDSANDLYDCVVDFSRDDANDQDEYTVYWRKNGVRQTSVTGGKITMFDRDNTTHIAADTAMTQIGSTGAWKYDATSSERITVGNAAIVTFKATIDAAERTFNCIVGRDSSA